MATVPQCDRCKSYNVQVVPVLGKDLCKRCIDAFHVWSSGMPRVTKDGRAGFGERWKQVEAIVARDGCVTSEALAELSDIHRTTASYYLHQQAKRGRLRFLGNRRFVLAESTSGH